VPQLREAFHCEGAPRYLILDRDLTFSQRVTDVMKSFGIIPVRASYRSPWQNGVAARWVASCRRELLDHVVVFGGKPLDHEEEHPPFCGKNHLFTQMTFDSNRASRSTLWRLQKQEENDLVTDCRAVIDMERAGHGSSCGNRGLISWDGDRE